MSKTWFYIQDSGVILDEQKRKVTVGWAGHGAGRNNPAMQQVHDTGPLPQGLYKVGSWGDAESEPSYPAHLGPFIASITQIEGETFGRSGFYIHGPGGADPLQSSKGCIEIHRPGRLLVMQGAPDFMRVVGTAADAVAA